MTCPGWCRWSGTGTGRYSRRACWTARRGNLQPGSALYCPDCRAVVGDVLPGTAGLADVDGLPDPAADLLLRREASLAAAHALDPAARRTGAPGETRYAAAR